MIYFLLIAGVWAAFLLPPALAKRRLSPASSTEEFSKLTRQLGKARHVETPDVIGPHGGRQARLERDRVIARRRQILVGLGAVAVATLVGAIAVGNVQLLLVHLLADAALAWYVVMLLQIKARQTAEISVLDIRPLSPSADHPQVKVVSNR